LKEKNNITKRNRMRKGRNRDSSGVKMRRKEPTISAEFQEKLRRNRIRKFWGGRLQGGAKRTASAHKTQGKKRSVKGGPEKNNTTKEGSFKKRDAMVRERGTQLVTRGDEGPFHCEILSSESQFYCSRTWKTRRGCVE